MHLVEYRCYVSGRLLCKARGDGQLEIMNPINRVMNYLGPSRKHQDVGPKGREFLQKSVDLSCKKCSRLLGRAIGTDLLAEIKCKHCHHISLFDIAKIQEFRLRPLSKVARKNVESQHQDL